MRRFLCRDGLLEPRAGPFAAKLVEVFNFDQLALVLGVESLLHHGLWPLYDASLPVLIDVAQGLHVIALGRLKGGRRVHRAANAGTDDRCIFAVVAVHPHLLFPNRVHTFVPHHERNPGL